MWLSMTLYVKSMKWICKNFVGKKLLLWTKCYIWVLWNQIFSSALSSCISIPIPPSLWIPYAWCCMFVIHHYLQGLCLPHFRIINISSPMYHGSPNKYSNTLSCTKNWHQFLCNFKACKIITLWYKPWHPTS
jgi:hypothetical protein